MSGYVNDVARRAAKKMKNLCDLCASVANSPEKIAVKAGQLCGSGAARCRDCCEGKD